MSKPEEWAADISTKLHDVDKTMTITSVTITLQHSTSNNVGGSFTATVSLGCLLQSAITITHLLLLNSYY